MPKGKPIDETGNRYGKLVVTSYAGKNNSRVRFWNCVCDCGNKTVSRGTSLRFGTSMSCGKCIRSTHGMGETTEYRVWAGMKTRCYNTGDDSYRNYGERGIYVCDRWVNSFETFYEDMGKYPGKGYSLDRIDNDGPYSPENCRWATVHEQQNNRRNNNVLTYDGKSMTVTQWSELLGINKQTLYARVRAGWTSEKALFTPVVRT